MATFLNVITRTEWKQNQLPGWSSKQETEFKVITSFQSSFPAGVRTRTSKSGGSFESKGGKLALPYLQEILGLKLRRE